MYTHIIDGDQKTLSEADARVIWNAMPETASFISGRATIEVNCAGSSALTIALDTSSTDDQDVPIKAAVMIKILYFDLFNLSEHDKDDFIMSYMRVSQYKHVFMVPNRILTVAKKRRFLDDLAKRFDINHIVSICDNARWLSLSTSFAPTNKMVIHTYLEPIISKCSSVRFIDNVKAYDACVLDPLIGTDISLKKVTQSNIKFQIKMGSIDDASRKAVETISESVKSLCSMISYKRCMDYHGFKLVGQTIYNAAFGSDDCLPPWKSLASKSEHLDECEQLWDGFDISDDRSINELRRWASVDSPEEFIKWRAASSEEHIRESLKITGGKADIANVFHSLNQDRYVCSDFKNDYWYVFILKWRAVDGTYSVKKAIVEELIPRYMTALAELNMELGRAQTDVERTKWTEYINRCIKIIVNLKDDQAVTSIVRNCAQRFYDENFEMERDSINHFVGFDNGKFDVTTSAFVPQDPKDRITISCGYPMPIHYHWDHPDVKRVQDIISMIITNPVTRAFMMHIFVYSLRTGNRIKKLICSIGPPNTGKSVLQNLCELAFGFEYCVTPPIEQLTWQGETNPDGATASREILKYAKQSWYSEPRVGAKLNDGIFKTVVSGGDGLFSRNLHQGVSRKMPLKVVPGAIPFYTANYPPKYDGADMSVHTKIVPIKNDSMFVDLANNTENIQVPATFEEQMKARVFPMDTNLKQELKDKKLGEAFMWILCQLNESHKDKPIIIPASVKEFAKTISKRNDPINDFLEARVISKPGGKGISAEALYATFVIYHKSRYPNDMRNGPSSADIFEDKMIQKKYVLHNGLWQDIQLDE